MGREAKHVSVFFFFFFVFGPDVLSSLSSEKPDLKIQKKKKEQRKK